MTKEHFIELADKIRSHNRTFKGSTSYFEPLQIELLADFCKWANPKFDRERWVNYINNKCGPNGGKV